MNVGKKLKTLRTDCGLTQLDVVGRLAKRGIDINQSALSKWELGSREPSISQLVALCDIYGANDIRYALTGERSIAVPDIMFGLNRYGREHVQRYVDFLQGDDVFTKPDPVKIIRLYDLPASAGTGQMFFESSDYTEIAVPENDVPYGTDFAVSITGDSMEPRIQDKDILFIEKREEINIGDIGVCEHNGAAYCKQIGEKGLISLNKKYPLIPVGEFDTFRVFGRFIGKWDRG